MKKLFYLIAAFLLFTVEFTYSQALTNPRFYGDFTPCKNQKAVSYTIATPLVGGGTTSSTSIIYCAGESGYQTFQPTQWRWNGPAGAVIKDPAGNKTGQDGFLYTTYPNVYVDYKTKGGTLGCYYKDSLGVWKELYWRTINLSCEPGDDPYATSYVVLPVDTGVTLYGVDIISSLYQLSFQFDSTSVGVGPYGGFQLYKKCTTCNCGSYRAVEFSDGYYQQVGSSTFQGNPFYVPYGYTLLIAAPGYQTLRMSGGNGSRSFVTLPFQINTTVGNIENYPVLPAP